MDSLLHSQHGLEMTSNTKRGEDLRGMEIFEVHPVILGGSATDAANKIALTRSEHIQAVRYWNQEIRRIREHQSKKKTS